ncbi:hypothetical protein ATO13_18545 [Stappia sp. 22II-S9-Z10]|nr:hypothetical protein ATO13_18545 [Stappia sp. 22II-S9-Z10]
MTAALPINRILISAQKLADAGQYLEAHAAYLEILSRFPENVRARDGLKALTEPARIVPHEGDSAANLAKAMGRMKALAVAGAHAEALQIALPLAARYPDAVELQFALGIIEERLGNRAAAIAAHTAAIKAQPTFSAALLRLATLLADIGEFKAGIAFNMEAVRVEPFNADMHRLLGAALMRAGDAAKAASAFGAAIALAPAEWTLLTDRGLAHHHAGAYAAALADYDRALHLVRDDAAAAEIHIKRGNALRDCLRHEDAAAAFRTALAHEPQSEVALCNLGQVLGEMGRAGEAAETLRAALAIDPAYASAHANLANWTTYRAGHPHIAEMEALLEQEQRSGARTRLNFALGTAYDATGQSERAFAHLSAANAARYAERPYDPDHVERQFAAIAKVFEAGALPAWQGRTDDGPRPLFVVGMPRSGSSLAEQILAAHPEVDGAGETGAFERAAQLLIAGLEAGEAPCQAIIGEVRAAFRAAIAELPLSAPVVVDKSLSNTRRVGLIAAIFPEARFVLMSRDAVATGWSIYKHDFTGPGNSYASDLAAIGHYMRQEAALVARWGQLFPGRILPLDYRDLTEEPAVTTRMLLAFCGLKFNPACLAPHMVERPVMTASAGQVRQPIYAGSSAVWQRYAAHLGPLIMALGDLGGDAAAVARAARSAVRAA